MGNSSAPTSIESINGQNNSGRESGSDSEIERFLRFSQYLNQMQGNNNSQSDANDRIQRLKDDLDQYSRRITELQNENANLVQKHATEKNKIIEQWRTKYDDLKDECHRLETKNQLLENGKDGSVFEKIFSAIAENFDSIGEFISALAAGGAGISPEQIQQLQGAVQNSDNSNAQNPSPEQIDAAMNELKEKANQNPTNSKQPPQSKSQHEQTMPDKSQVIKSLLTHATKAMLSQNPNISKYSDIVLSQIQIIQQQGQKIDKKDYIYIAEQLASKAVQEEIPPERVALVLDPFMGKIKAFRTFAAVTDAPTLANQLFALAGKNPKEPVKKLIINVISALKEQI